MDKIKVYKPGQLITINNKVYRIQALVEEEPRKDEAIKDRIEFIKRIKNLIKQDRLWYSTWFNDAVYAGDKYTSLYVRATNIEKNFEFLNEMFDLYLLKHSKESIRL